VSDAGSGAWDGGGAAAVVLGGVADGRPDGLGAAVLPGVVEEHAVAKSTRRATAIVVRVCRSTWARYQRAGDPRFADPAPQARGSTGEPDRTDVSITEVPDLRIDLAPAAEAIGRVGRRLADLLSSAEQRDGSVKGLEWTLGELTAHLAARSARFAAYLAGSATPQGEVSDIGAENQEDIRVRREVAFADLVAELRASVDAFVATTRGRLGSDPFGWYSGITLDVATGSGLLLAELVVHGLDAARTLDRPWPIAADDARTIVRAAVALAPWYVDTERTRGERTTYRVSVRGGPAFRVRVEDGTASVEPADGPADCTIHADPVTLALLVFGRTGRAHAAVRGKLVATGRRPWRALRFERSFLPP
jgi:uncharacterized protein (TIGR03083 family)